MTNRSHYRSASLKCSDSELKRLRENLNEAGVCGTLTTTNTDGLTEHHKLVAWAETAPGTYLYLWVYEWAKPATKSEKE